MKKIVLIMLILIFFFPMQSNVSAAGHAEVYELLIGNGIPYKGPYYRDHGSFDAMRFDVGGREGVISTITSYADETFTEPLTTKSFKASDYGFSHFTAMGFTCNAHYIGEIKEFDGDIVLKVKMTVSGLEKPKCDSEPTGDLFEENDLGDGSDGDGTGGNGDGSGENGDGSGGNCEGCQIFNCPGWDDYMGKLDDIKNAIPPAPNWNQVSQTFSDAIVPRLVNETRDMLDDLLGWAPEPTMPDLPKTPDLPNTPAMLDELDDRGLQEPTGQEAPGLEDAVFTADDLKNSAPDIPVREDPTGGFKIDNPIDTLPSQEEFQKNIPNEGVAPLPGEPKELENIAPTPAEPPNKAPVPSEQPNAAPVPSEQPNRAPMPGNTENIAPTPKEGHDAAPIPGLDNSRAPVPGGG